jgi:hypothetical protein
MKNLFDKMLAVAKEHDIVCITPTWPPAEGTKIGDMMLWGPLVNPSREHRSNMVMNLFTEKARKDGSTIVYHDLEMSFDEVAAKMLGVDLKDSHK